MTSENVLWTVHSALNHLQANLHSAHTCSFFCQLSLI